MTTEQMQQIIDILHQNLIEDEQLNEEDPWGEDGAIYAFEVGQSHGAHYLARKILDILGDKS